jgi:hypothetical protein
MMSARGERSGTSSVRAWIGRSLVAVGIVLGVLAAVGGSVIGGALLGVTLSGIGGALLWIARGQDDRAVARRKRLAGIAALAGGGAFFGVVGVAMRATGDPEGTFVGLVGATAVAAAALWWITTRDSRLADSVQAPVQLGDGRLEHGTVVTMPCSKRVALAIGALLMGGAFVAFVPAMLADGDWRAWLMAAAGAFILLVGGPLLTITAVREASLAVSPTGVTIRFRGSHYTVPWEAVDHAGIFEFTTHHRGIEQTHRQLGIAADLDHAIGTLRDRARRAGRRGLDARGWSICFPQTVFDLHIEDVAALVNDAHPHLTSR